MSFDGLTHEIINSVNLDVAGNMTGTVVFYDPGIGEIRQVQQGSLTAVKLTHDATGRPFFSVPDGTPVSFDHHYVVGTELRERPVLNVRFIDGVLAGVPAGARLIINGQSFMAEGGNIEVATDPGQEVNISVDLWPYRLARIHHAEN